MAYIKNCIKNIILKVKYWRSDIRIGKNVFISSKSNIIMGKNSRLTIKDNVYISDNVRLIVHENSELILDNGVYVSWSSLISSNSKVVIGENTLIAHFVTIIDTNKNYKNINMPIRMQGSNSKPITIGNDCWITTGVVILGGVTIGKHTVIAANSVVNKSFGDNLVIGGIPSKIIKEMS
jgi:acetyltransferase-like isoleucine patch superfamily enzyme